MTDKTTTRNDAPSAWITNLSGIFSGLLLLAILFIATLIGSAGIVLIGRVLTALFQLNTFEASLIALGAAFVVLYSFTQIVRSPTVLSSPPDYDWEDELDDWDDEDFEDEEEVEEKIIPPASRNDPCPCGSGRKYKNCHGR